MAGAGPEHHPLGMSSGDLRLPSWLCGHTQQFSSKVEVKAKGASVQSRTALTERPLLTCGNAKHYDSYDAEWSSCSDAFIPLDAL